MTLTAYCAWKLNQHAATVRQMADKAMRGPLSDADTDRCMWAVAGAIATNGLLLACLRASKVKP